MSEWSCGFVWFYWSSCVSLPDQEGSYSKKEHKDALIHLQFCASTTIFFTKVIIEQKKNIKWATGRVKRGLSFYWPGVTSLRERLAVSSGVTALGLDRVTNPHRSSNWRSAAASWSFSLGQVGFSSGKEAGRAARGANRAGNHRFLTRWQVFTSFSRTANVSSLASTFHPLSCRN